MGGRANEEWLTSDLSPGTLVVERYVYENRNGGNGVQWLAQVVSKEGLLLLLTACKTRREALEACGSYRGIPS